MCVIDSMKILNVIGSINPAHWGALEWVKQYGRVATSQGHTIDVATLDPPGSPWISDFPLEVHALGNQYNCFYSRALVPWLQKFQQNYDCVLVHGLWRYPSFGTWLALRRSDTPYFVYTHGMLGPWFKRQYPLKHLAKSAYWLCADYRVLRDARAVLFTCEQERRHSRMSFRPYKCTETVAELGISDPQSSYGATDEELFATFPNLRGKRLILFIGRLHPVKGCDILIRAFANASRVDPSAHLLIAGPDPLQLRPKLEMLAKENNIVDRLTWAGMLTGGLKWSTLRAADALALPSHHENFSFVTVEALAVGLPVLMTREVGIWREVHQFGAGLVGDDNVDSFRHVMETWLTLPASARLTARAAARKCFEELFDVIPATKRLLDALATHGIN